ncbi:hypothetical protein DFH05DRAFT_1540538 [Lentinula detonsa]|uniref:F-box domain-containing protein n=1 Tax=Lentinula detonsa TaxID=2804962 RepID=A0A9W8U286_9AGAR|nr:hypothetical protein DFH05DRAFT_1540538 [Lentinula detonsa]
MGQYWKLINVDNQQTTGYIGNLGEIFWYKNSVITTLLIAPVIPPQFKSKPAVSKARILEVQNDSTTVPSATLLTLPFEILHCIAEELMDDYLALICFSLTCVTMWELTHPVRYRVLESELKNKSWAGGRIILLGDYARGLPKGMLTAEEIEQLILNHGDEELSEEYSDEDEHVPDNNMDYRLGRLLEDASENFQQVSLKLNISIFDDKRVWNHRSLYRQLLKFPPRFRHWFSFEWSQFIPNEAEGGSWMVRNFSKREFVAKFSPRNLTQVVFSLIGRSDDPSISMFEGDWLVDGAWAGDSIDITLASIHEQEHGNETDWKDITAEVKQKLEALAETESQTFEF